MFCSSTFLLLINFPMWNDLGITLFISSRLKQFDLIMIRLSIWLPPNGQSSCLFGGKWFQTSITAHTQKKSEVFLGIWFPLWKWEIHTANWNFNFTRVSSPEKSMNLQLSLEYCDLPMLMPVCVCVWRRFRVKVQAFSQWTCCLPSKLTGSLFSLSRGSSWKKMSWSHRQNGSN